MPVEDPFSLIIEEDTVSENQQEGDKQELSEKTDLVLSDVKTLTIKTDEQFQNAANFLKTIKAIQKEIDDYFDPAIRKAHEAHKEILNAKKKQSEPLQQAERILKSKISQYHAEEERKRLEEQRRIEEEARKKAEERRLNEAIETGDDSILDEPIIVPQVQVKDTTKTEGISYQDNWKFRVIDKKKVPEEYKMIDEKKIGQVVRAMKEKTNIPGIEVYPEKIVKAKV